MTWKVEMNEQLHVIEVTESNIRDILQQSMDKPVLLDIWAEWCEPCKAQLPILEKLVESYQGKFLLAKLDAENQQMLILCPPYTLRTLYVLCSL